MNKIIWFNNFISLFIFFDWLINCIEFAIDNLLHLKGGQLLGSVPYMLTSYSENISDYGYISALIDGS